MCTTIRAVPVLLHRRPDQLQVRHRHPRHDRCPQDNSTRSRGSHTGAGGLAGLLLSAVTGVAISELKPGVVAHTSGSKPCASGLKPWAASSSSARTTAPRARRWTGYAPLVRRVSAGAQEHDMPSLVDWGGARRSSSRRNIPKEVLYAPGLARRAPGHATPSRGHASRPSQGNVLKTHTANEEKLSCMAARKVQTVQTP